jgi:hypothetical protein
MFATVFLLLGLKYYKKPAVYIVLTAACIAIHRLTGVFALLFSIVLICADARKWNQKMYVFIAITMGALSYLPALSVQIIPLI